jgi:pteridine reductase
MLASIPKVALVTGSGKRRVGWHVADALAGLGYALVIHYRRSSAEAAEAVALFRSRGVEAVGLQADLADEQAVRKLIGDTLARFGRIDVLVNCAAVWKAKRLEDVAAADARAHWEANTLGTFLCARHAGLAMARRRPKAVASSTWGTGPRCGRIRTTPPTSLPRGQSRP